MKIMRAATTHGNTTTDHAWADASGRSFFAWRMAAACEDALREVDRAISLQADPERTHALKKASTLLKRQLRRWVREGEALDDLVSHLPQLPD
jgi:hypothetical protein